MTEDDPANVLAAYDMLLEELEAEIDRLNKAGGRAFAAADHARAQQLLARVQKLIGLRGELAAWGQRLRPLVAEPEREPGQRRLRDGAKTPEDAYRLPILRTLVAMGGSGEVAAVLDRVYDLVKDRLNEYGLASLPSGRTARWRNTAQWCRNTLREEGLIKDGSPRGVWEITERCIPRVPRTDANHQGYQEHEGQGPLAGRFRRRLMPPNIGNSQESFAFFVAFVVHAFRPGESPTVLVHTLARIPP